MIFRPFGKVVEIVGHIPPSRGIYYTERICFFDEQRAKNEPRTEKVVRYAIKQNRVAPNTPLGIPLHHCL